MKRAFDGGGLVGCAPTMPVGAVYRFCEHYHLERNHQRLENRIIEPELSSTGGAGEVNRRERLGRLLRHYYREAAWNRRFEFPDTTREF